MAASSLLALLDDIATILDDVSVMTKVAAQKTAGVLGDDLALNAEQVTGVRAERELPVVWAVAKGAMLNKVILIPIALLISHFVPAMMTVLLMCGGLFLAFEGFEKVMHKVLHDEEEQKQERKKANASQKIDLVEFEKEKIKGAIRTDFILSAEIIVIAMSAVPDDAPFITLLLTLCAIGFGMTIGVYGLVAGIVKMDDAGLYLSQQDGAKAGFGRFLLKAAPLLLKGLGIVGTAAMFLVGGGIIAHGIPPIHHFIEHLMADSALHGLIATIANGIVGIIAGGLAVAVYTGVNKVRGKEAAH